MIHIVLGTGFGDEGKGQCVHSLSDPETLVIRFSGGHQCGHTVMTTKGDKHIFSQFGAGTFQGASTYISQYCTLFPTGLWEEFKSLQSGVLSGIRYYVHPMAMLTTPYDLAFNRALSMINGHGTCGVGFGTTLQRNEDFCNLYALDLKNPYILTTKLSLIEKYYEDKVKQLNISSQITYEQELETAMGYWEKSLDFFREYVQVTDINEISGKYTDFVFEGSQGILLDQHFGFFPHVTRSNTTSQNAWEIIRENEWGDQQVHTWYVSRCYQTRHGNGPFPDERKIELINIEEETNQENDWQGIFRIAEFDKLQVEHALNCDKVYNKKSKKHMVFTCLDQLKNPGNFLKEIETATFLKELESVETKNSPFWL